MSAMDRAYTSPTSQAPSDVSGGPKSSLRRSIMAFVGGLILLSVLGSTVSVYRITEVNSLLDAINRVSVPLGRLFTQMQSDAEIFTREWERGLGYSHWKDEHWSPRPVPNWIQDVIQNEMEQAQTLIRTDEDWATPESRARWAEWATNMNQQLASLRAEAAKLHDALEHKDYQAATEIYPKWSGSMEEWRRQLQWGATEFDRQVRQTFSRAESRVSQLRAGLEILLVAVVLLSLLMLWFGERALRPLAELTRLAREITRRGLRRGDKALFPEIPLTRNDEVSQLAREFHRMATALLEREKTVETQKDRLQEQNHLLRQMGTLNENVLNSIESILIVVDLHGRITQCNPVATRWLLGEALGARSLFGSELSSWDKLAAVAILFPENAKRGESTKINPIQIESRTYGGHWMPLRQESETSGMILVLDDLTEEVDLQERLNRAEHLAAVGRMSAQVAHEVRNPLHSIGLEAEMAADLAANLGQPALKQSLQSILRGVDRLEKITENYLKLSRLSSGSRTIVDLGDVLESVLATYTSLCEAQNIRVDWRREKNANLQVIGDRDLLEQVFGNLMRNSIQSLEGRPKQTITWSLGQTDSRKVWARIEDNGPGVPVAIRSKLFTPFVTTKAQGTGLGLSFVKKVIEDQGGTIVYWDRGSNPMKIDGAAAKVGACFEMMIPEAGAMLESFSPSAVAGPQHQLSSEVLPEVFQ
jgi:signal transduction histidine kinase/HAMP domain-containing protein